LNLTPNVYHNFELGVPKEGVYEEILNSDKDVYYGSNQYNGLPLETIMEPRHKFRQHIKVTLGPLTGLILKYKGKKSDKNDKL
jgi:1,4-alpha-glucan branching enzyme